MLMLTFGEMLVYLCLCWVNVYATNNHNKVCVCVCLCFLLFFTSFCYSFLYFFKRIFLLYLCLIKDSYYCKEFSFIWRKNFSFSFKNHCLVNSGFHHLNIKIFPRNFHFDFSFKTPNELGWGHHTIQAI